MVELGFLLKKLLGVILMPVPIVCLLVGLSLFFLFKGSYKKAKRYGSISFILLLLFSLPITSRLMLMPIERSVTTISLTELSAAQQPPQYIWVLGCYHYDDELPLVAKFHACSLNRIVQAVQFWHQLPNLTLIFSGAAAKQGGISHPQISAQLAQQLGVPSDNIQLIIGTKDTEEGIQRIKQLVADKPFVAISSASHLRRMANLFNRYGLQPQLSASEYLAPHARFSYHLLIPSSASLKKTERAFYEVLGLLWVNVKAFFQV